MGVHAVMSKRELTPDRLFEAITDAQSEASRGAHELWGGEGGDAQIVARAGHGTGYRLGSLIGQGAMSRVYLAERVTDKATVVIKIMDGTLSHASEGVQQFVLEAALASKKESTESSKQSAARSP
jgi:serine/threonine protein kinase